MPIKEILVLSAIALTSIAATHPGRFQKVIREIKFGILQETARTDNWGNPSLFLSKKLGQKNSRRDE